MSTKPLVLTGPSGRIEVSADVLDALATGAVSTVGGAALARGRRVVEVAPDDGRIEAHVAITADAGRILPELGVEVQRAVADALATATGLDVRVDVSVVGLTS